MPAMDGTTRQALAKAIVDAFDRDGLEQLLYYRLEKSLDRITGNSSLDKAVFDVVRNSEMEGWTPQLVAAMREERPANAMVAAVAARVGLAAGAPSGRKLERMISEAAGLLDPVEWRGRLGRIEAQVCRIEIPVAGGSIRGTGFLVGPDEVMTNHHVVRALIDGEAEPERARLRFDFKRLDDGVTVNPGVEFGLDADEWLVASAPPSEVDELADPGDRVPDPGELDFALLRLDTPVGEQPVGEHAAPDAPERGWIELEDPGRPPDGSPIFIMQHPEGEPVKLAVDAILCTNANGTRIRYRANTEGGSSGSPCFDIDLRLIALHHSGDPNFDPAHKPEYNEGIPIGAIAAHLEGAAAGG